jgi:hypothetical protein
MKVGERYISDKGFNNSGEVTLVAIHGKYFCRVMDHESVNKEEWDTMLDRLSSIEVKLTESEPLIGSEGIK